MASQADISKGSDSSNERTEMQHQSDLEALDDRLALMRKRLALCNAVLDDLRATQRIVQEKGLRGAAFQEQNK